jgi:type VI protein secretion system component VasK
LQLPDLRCLSALIRAGREGGWGGPVSDAVCLVVAALLAQSQVTSTPQPSGPPAPTQLYWTAAGSIAAALITVLLTRVVNRRKDKVDTLEKQQQMFERQLKIDEELEEKRQRLREWERSLDERERMLNERHALPDELARRRRSRHEGTNGEAS